MAPQMPSLRRHPRHFSRGKDQQRRRGHPLANGLEQMNQDGDFVHP